MTAPRLEGPAGEPMFPRPRRTRRWVGVLVTILVFAAAGAATAVYFGVDLRTLNLGLADPATTSARSPIAAGPAPQNQASQDGVPRDGVATLVAAVRRLETLNRKTLAAEQRLPKLANPDEAPILAAVWSKPAVLGHGPYTAKDIAALEQIVQIEANIGLIYARFVPRPGLKPNLLANGIAYQDELVSTVVFNDDAYAALIEAITDDIAKKDPQTLTQEQRAAFAKVQRLVNENTHSLLEEIEMRLRLENVDRLIAALQANAATFAAEATPDERRDNIQRIRAAGRSRSRDQRAGLEAVVDAMKVTGCTGLCALREAEGSERDP